LSDAEDTGMKLISSIVRPEMVEVIKAALNRLNVFGLTVAQVLDYAPQRHETTVWRGHEYTLGYCVKMAIDFVVHDDDVDEMVKLLMCTARTGDHGDGFVSVLPVEHRYNIRSGEREVT
jgi:nitrogen regulatory protein PII